VSPNQRPRFHIPEGLAKLAGSGLLGAEAPSAQATPESADVPLRCIPRIRMARLLS